MRIAIIGYSGSGKSTLAAQLGQAYGVPVLHLDSVHWLPGWVERAREEEKALVRAFLDRNKSWVIDGNYSALYYEERLEKAELQPLCLPAPRRKARAAVPRQNAAGHGRGLYRKDGP